jgi:hypothetical protein
MTFPPNFLPIYLKKYLVAIQNPVDENTFTRPSLSSVGVLPSSEDGFRIWTFQLTGTLLPNKEATNKDYQFLYNFNNVNYDKYKIRFDNGVSGIATICNHVLDASKIFSFQYSIASGVFTFRLNAFQLGFVIKNPTQISYTLYVKDKAVANDTSVDIPLATVVPVISYGSSSSLSEPPPTYLWAVNNKITVNIITNDDGCSITAETDGAAVNTICKYNLTQQAPGLPCTVSGNDLLGISDYFKFTVQDTKITYDLPDMKNHVPFAYSEIGDINKSTGSVQETFNTLYQQTTKDISGIPSHNHGYWQANVNNGDSQKVEQGQTPFQAWNNGTFFENKQTSGISLGITKNPNPGIDNLEATQDIQPLTAQQNPSNDQTKQSYLPPFYGLPYLLRFCECIESCPNQGDFGNPIPISFDAGKVYLSYIPTAILGSGTITIPDGWENVTSSYSDSYFCQTGEAKDTLESNRRGENYKVSITSDQMQPHFHTFKYYGLENYTSAYAGGFTPVLPVVTIRKNVKKDPTITKQNVSNTGDDYHLDFSCTNGLSCVILQNKDTIMLNCNVGMIIFCSEEINDNANLLPLTQDFSKYQIFTNSIIKGLGVKPSDLPNFKANGGYILGLDLPSATTDEEAIANASWIRQYTGKVKGDAYPDWFQTTKSLSEVYVKVKDHDHTSKTYISSITEGQTGDQVNPSIPRDMKQYDKKTLSSGNGKPINILPSSIQGLVAHLVVDAQIVYDTCQFTIPSGPGTSGTPFTVSSAGGTTLVFAEFGGPKESKVKEELPFCLQATLQAPVMSGNGTFQYPNSSGQYSSLSIDNICVVNGPLDFSTSTYAGKFTQFPLYTLNGTTSTGQSGPVGSCENGVNLPGPATLSFLLEFSTLPPKGTKFTLDASDQNLNPLYKVDITVN